jgi:hypothetical protein
LGQTRARRVVLIPTREYTGGKLMESYEAHRGTVVRVREGHWNGEFAGMRGTIQESWISVVHGAVDILLEDGSLRLFWLADLSVVDEDIAV